MTINKKFAGAAAVTTVVGSMTASVPGAGQTFVVASDAGYPATGRFVVRLNRGKSDEEKVLCASRSGTTFTVETRGYDGTTAQPHDAPTCEHWVDAATIQALADHADDLEADPHSAKLLNNARHDTTDRHAFGAALGNPGTPTAVVANQAAAVGGAAVPAKADHTHTGPVTAAPVSVGTANAAGSGTNLALANHVHDIGAGAIDGTGLFGGDMKGYISAAADPGAVGAGVLWWDTTNEVLKVRNGGNSAWRTLAEPTNEHIALATRISGLIVAPNTETQVDFNVSALDPLGMISLASDTITLTKDGWWNVKFGGTWEVITVDGGNAQAYVSVNSTDPTPVTDNYWMRATIPVLGNVSDGYWVASWDRQFLAGDVLRLFVNPQALTSSDQQISNIRLKVERKHA